MLTICLDESGIFEDEKYKKPLIIGGFIYTGEDYIAEEERLKEFYKNACKEIESQLTIKEGRVINVEYPIGIHSTENRGRIGWEINRLLSEKVFSYIKNNKKYYLTAMIKSKDMEETFDYQTFGDERNSVLNFDKGANLYERMATKFLYNNIFYNPLLKDKNEKINLNLATRTINVEEDSEIYKELIKLDYRKNINNDGTYRFYITSSSTFKVALATKVYESQVEKNLDYSLNVESINYKKEGTTPFLYLADSVCEIIKEQIKAINGEFDILKLVNIMKDKTGQDFLCFIHDDIDLVWTKLVEKLYEKDLIGALEKIAEIKNSTSKHKSLYLDFWIPVIKEDLVQAFNKDKVDSYLADLDYFFGKDNSRYEKGFIVAKELLKIVDVKSLRNESYIKYKINEKIALAYNHRGSIGKALEYFNVCENLKYDGVPVVEYLTTKNRKTVAMTNACAYEKSIEELMEQLPKYTKIAEAYFEIAADMGLESDESYMVKEQGKILSAIAQNLSFLRKYDEAEKSFNEALSIFTRAGDKAVTKSYLIHMYIDSKNREKYEELIKEDFNTLDLEEQMRLIFSDSNKIDRYKLFIYTKALNTLYEKNVKIELVQSLIKAITIMIKDTDFNQHPKQMIVKHVAQLAYKKGLEKEAANLMKHHLTTIENSEFTINLIIEKANIDYLNLKKNNIHVNNKIERAKIDKEIIKNIDRIKEEIIKEGLAFEVFSSLLNTESTNVQECIELLDQRLTYMYN